MVSSPEPAPTRPSAAGLIGDLPSRATSSVDTLVELLRDKTVRPATLATRAIVFGIIVLAASVVTVTLLAITLIRILTVYAFDGRVWLSDLVVGALFVIAGLVAWRFRRTPDAGHQGA